MKYLVHGESPALTKSFPAFAAFERLLLAVNVTKKKKKRKILNCKFKEKTNSFFFFSLLIFLRIGYTEIFGGERRERWRGYFDKFILIIALRFRRSISEQFRLINLSKLITIRQMFLPIQGKKLLIFNFLDLERER